MHVDELVERYRGHDLDRQSISWNPDMWRRVWDEPGPSAGTEELPGRRVLQLIAAEVAANDGAFRRSWLLQLADGDPVEFLAATVIWGYGNFGRGLPALRAMLGERKTAEDVGAVVTSLVAASRRSPAEGFRALFDDRGRTRIARLGIAFGTKVVHFAGYRHADIAPIILDKRVWTAAQSLSSAPRVPNPTRYTTGPAYEGYCAWAGEVAARHQVEPAMVEYALFQHGGSGAS